MIIKRWDRPGKGDGEPPAGRLSLGAKCRARRAGIPARETPEGNDNCNYNGNCHGNGNGNGI
jgi:hypothetical protein